MDKVTVFPADTLSEMNMTSLGPFPNYSWDDRFFSTMNSEDVMFDNKELQLYLRVTCLVFLFIIFTVGTVGNVMVTLVIGSSRDMRTSTNIFLVNLSIADLLVLLVCTPTAVIEVTHHPERWILGYYLCKFVPLLEATVAHASVLTILAISFERYYAICCPLRANYICTKSRAVSISIAAWVLATFITSPTIMMIQYKEGINEKGAWTARCTVSAGNFWPDLYTISTIILFFLVPLFILLVTYGKISRRLTMESVTANCNAKNENHKARKQVVVMLGSVCVTFFLCLLPFRVITLFVLLADHELLNQHVEAYDNFVYFSRIMVYLNSCLNPLLYNVMSSKFRNGFLRLCNRRRKPSPFSRTGTFLTNTTNSTTMSINLGNGLLSARGSGHNSPETAGSSIRRNGNVLKGGEEKTLKKYLLSHSHGGSNGYLLSHKTPASLFNGIGNGSGSGTHATYYPFQESPRASSSFRNQGVTLGKQFDSSSSSNYGTGNHFSGTCVKSDAIYSAYIPGRRSETVL